MSLIKNAMMYKRGQYHYFYAYKFHLKAVTHETFKLGL
jgi:hypothetical protein